MITWATILANASKIGPALGKAWKWYKKSLKNDSFALVVGVLFLLSLAGNVVMQVRPDPQTVIPAIEYINGTPITITKPVTIKVYPGYIPIVEPGGKLRVDTVGFRFIPKAGLAFNGNFQPVAGARFFILKRFGVEAVTSRNALMLGPDYALGYLRNVTVSAGVCKRWNELLLPTPPGVYACMSVCLR